MKTIKVMKLLSGLFLSIALPFIGTASDSLVVTHDHSHENTYTVEKESGTNGSNLLESDHTQDDHSGWQEVSTAFITSSGYQLNGTLEHTYYFLNSNGASTSQTIKVSGTVTLCLFGGTLTGPGNATVIEVNSNASLTICTCTGSGTITGGGGDTGNGAGINVLASGSLTLDGGTISGNYFTSVGNGGGVALNNGARFTMNGGTISGNTASTGSTGYGGGVYVGTSSTFEMYDGNITNNTASTGANGYGGGVAVLSGASFTMHGGTISSNYLSSSNSQEYGAGVRLNGGTFTMLGGQINNNKPYNNSSLTNNALSMTYDNSTTPTFSFYGGYLAGTITRYSGTINLYGGYMGDATYNNLSSSISSNSSLYYVYLADLDNPTSFDPAYNSAFRHAIYTIGQTPSYSANVTEYTICENTNYVDYIEIVGNTLDADITYSCSHCTFDGVLPTTPGTHTLTATIAEHINHNVTPKLYYAEGSTNTFNVTINEHQGSGTLNALDNEFHYDKCVNDICDDYLTNFESHNYTWSVASGFSKENGGSITGWCRTENDGCGYSYTLSLDPITDQNTDTNDENQVYTSSTTYALNCLSNDETTYTYLAPDGKEVEVLTEIGDIGEHAYPSDDSYLKDYTEHWIECANGCGIEKERANHDSDAVWVKSGDYINGFDFTKSCSTCGDIVISLGNVFDDNSYTKTTTEATSCLTQDTTVYSYTTPDGVLFDNLHTVYGDYGNHSYGNTLKYNESYHYYECLNDPTHIAGEESHNWGSWTDILTNETSIHQERYCLECNYRDTRTITSSVTVVEEPVEEEETSGFNWIWIILIILGVIFLINLIVVFILMYKRKKRQKELQDKLDATKNDDTPVGDSSLETEDDLTKDNSSSDINNDSSTDDSSLKDDASKETNK